MGLSAVLRRWFRVFVVAGGFAAGMPHPAEGMPPNPEPVKLKQPDGTPIVLRVKGGPFNHWHEDTNGYPVVVDATGRYVYATLDASGRLKATVHVVGKADPSRADLGIPRHVIPAPRNPGVSNPENPGIDGKKP